MQAHIPGSKSVTNRALVLAAAHRTSRLSAPLVSDHTIAFRDALTALGARVTTASHTRASRSPTASPRSPRTCGRRASRPRSATTASPSSPAPPGPARPGRTVCRRDHRNAMAFRALGLRARGVTLDDPGCVSTAFPGFHTEPSRLFPDPFTPTDLEEHR
ncbi:hypothetical protein [Streptomyces sp. NPDC058964]|uniref:hypothetical protein n=1 Tax=Streptomyces sp. NPDC058964 TaxID=3346681 RepID=UPI003675B763